MRLYQMVGFAMVAGKQCNWQSRWVRQKLIRQTVFVGFGDGGGVDDDGNDD